MEALRRARQEIDRIDAELARLYTERMAAAREIAACKREAGLPVFDPAREREVLTSAAARIADPTLRPGYLALLRQLMDQSKRLQRSEQPESETVLPVLLPDGTYPVLVADGLLARAKEHLDLDRNVFLVTDSGVPAQYARTLAAQCRRAEVVTVPAGEASKSMGQFESILTGLQQGGWKRGDCVAAVGGGMVGDLAGFAAACYLRGIDFYHVPTTLLAMVDASVGGKTALNFGGVKNSVGAFSRPKAVLIDPSLLDTLPPRQLAAGMAEVVKMALTSDADLFADLEQGRTIDRRQLIVRALRIKISVVEADEKETGLRRVLNFGHTLGHGIEAARKGALLHGECVSLGMLPMCSPDVRKRLHPLLARLGLPTRVRTDPDEVLAAVVHDKKACEGGIETVYVEAPGCFRFEKIGLPVLRERLRLILEENAS